jgi:LysM repeat protein
VEKIFIRIKNTGKYIIFAGNKNNSKKQIMNKPIVYLMLALTILNASIIYAQGNNRQQAAGSSSQDNFSFYHTVERGETVYSISRMYDVDTTVIFRLNPGSSEMIKTGQLLKIPQRRQSAVSQDPEKETYLYHTIQTKETLYSVSQKYQVTAEAIMEANEGLNVQTFQIGKKIRIPIHLARKEPQPEKPAEVHYMEYTVKKGETFFSLTRKFEITEAALVEINPILKKGVKAGMHINIPIKDNTADTAAAQRETDANSLLNPTGKINRVDTVKLALLLPFMTDEKPASSNTARFVEYYEGLLLAIDSLQKKGLNVKLTVRDAGYGTKKLTDILKEKNLEETHLIIGGIDNEQIEAISTFAYKRRIKYVIPFASKNEAVNAQPNILQVNTPHHYLLSQAALTVYNTFKDYNIIFVDTKDPDDKLEFIGLVKQELSQHNISFRDVPFNRDAFYTDMERLLRKDRPNIIIPMSAKADCLGKIKPILRTLVDKIPDARISLFGYPEWQSHIRENLDDLFALDTYIYSNFYSDNRSTPVTRFATKYRLTYGKTLGGYPSFGMLGFDTGMFFLDALGRYGLSFDTYLDNINARGLQMSLRFKRVNNWGGFINTGLFIIRFNKENTRIQWQEIRQ